MSVTTTAARMAAMWRLIPGIATAFERIPRVILDAECPAVVFFPRSATYDTDSMGDNEVLEDRLWEPTLFVGPAYQGVEGQQQASAEVFFDRVRDYLLARPGLEVDNQADEEVVYDARLLGDGGYQVIAYPSGGNEVKDFAAIVWQHRVKEVAAIAYRD